MMTSMYVSPLRLLSAMLIICMSSAAMHRASSGQLDQLSSHSAVTKKVKQQWPQPHFHVHGLSEAVHGILNNKYSADHQANHSNTTMSNAETATLNTEADAKEPPATDIEIQAMPVDKPPETPSKEVAEKFLPSGLTSTISNIISNGVDLVTDAQSTLQTGLLSAISSVHSVLAKVNEKAEPFIDALLQAINATEDGILALPVAQAEGIQSFLNDTNATLADLIADASPSPSRSAERGPGSILLDTAKLVAQRDGLRSFVEHINASFAALVDRWDPLATSIDNSMAVVVSALSSIPGNISGVSQVTKLSQKVRTGVQDFTSLLEGAQDDLARILKKLDPANEVVQSAINLAIEYLTNLGRKVRELFEVVKPLTSRYEEVASGVANKITSGASILPLDLRANVSRQAMNLTKTAGFFASGLTEPLEDLSEEIIVGAQTVVSDLNASQIIAEAELAAGSLPSVQSPPPAGGHSASTRTPVARAALTLAALITVARLGL